MHCIYEYLIKSFQGHPFRQWKEEKGTVEDFPYFKLSIQLLRHREPYVLGTDIGTGSTKSVAVNFSGRPLGDNQVFYPSLQPQPGFSEQDPETIYRAVRESIKGIVEKMGYQPEAVSFSSAMHSLVLVDHKVRPITNLILWSDQRSAQVARQLLQEKTGLSLYARTGTPIHPMSPLSKIIWFRHNRPELFQQAAKFISVKEYIWYRLFSEFQVDFSIASTSGLFNIHQLQWDEEALACAGIRKENLSEPVSSKFIRKGIAEAEAKKMNLDPGTLCCIGAADGCLANLGTGVTSTGIAAVTVGTSGAVRISSPGPIINETHMTFCYLLDEETFICGGPVNNGGNILQWLAKVFLQKQDPTAKDYGKIFTLAESVPAGAEGLIFLPYLYGERAPVWDAESCGVFFGIRPVHQQPHFLRAGIEGICFALNQILNILEKTSGPIHQLNASGGFVQSEEWMQLLADITGKQIRVTQTEDASALGAALLALKAMGIQKVTDQDTGRSFFPAPGSVFPYKKNLMTYEKLYPALKETMHFLHQNNH